jgi:DNA-directed RNA polymerase specialized sigma24 family protein
MPGNLNISQEDFDAILAWLDPDRERAGIKYEELRRSLIRILSWKGCVDAEGLADETFNRVAGKLPKVKGTYGGDRRLYFYAVANNVAKEERKKANLHVRIEDTDLPAAPAPDHREEDREAEEECLSRCLQALTAESRALILDYYSKEKQAKIEHRKEMAGRHRLSVAALRVRMYRVRVGLEECINRCLAQRDGDE